ncbi:MAG: pantoate--beta-alanine ligase [Candidatus Ruthia sp.]|nr:pantoate--beta-alanine ligase [Candidatus Ruthturnera sp.]MBT4122817.1 pantoate--beta-alanine ligase [Candidatus Ruthturnera sp.]MBT4668697.1 pantoate--beta-alanine ligase [Candidatus Ruthturnera sp.]MBT6922370.1 pantoate--beta-alanine ligase [Candidatus Ruthturnera sp.]
MQISNTITDLQAKLNEWKSQGQSIAFVPTMGGLHDGHLALVALAKQKADKVIVSVFVNPTQFGENEDFDQYPNTLEQDITLLEQHQVDGLFTPNTDQIYPQDLENDIVAGELGGILCGVSRPEHFDGVAQVVHRLFEIVSPDVAVFGQKDYQQLLLIMQMTTQYFPEIKVLSQPTIREEDGLAMSTRNQYLSENERAIAPYLYQALLQAKQDYLNNTTVEMLTNTAKNTLSVDFKVDYFEALDANTLKQITDNTSKIAILCAVFLGSTRLIDNIIFNKG